MPLPNPIFTGRSQAALPGGVAGSAKYPTLPPSDFSDLAAWFRFGMGITVTGAGVSQWDDVSGNARHLKQGTDANRPALQADGSFLFNGTSHFLKCDAFTLSQPNTIYLLVKQVTFINGARILDGDAANSGRITQANPSPNINLFAGSSSLTNTTGVVGQYGLLTAVYSTSLSLLGVDANFAGPGTNIGNSNMGGLTLGAIGGGASNWANIQTKEFVVCTGAHDSTRQAQMRAWFASL